MPLSLLFYPSLECHLGSTAFIMSIQKLGRLEYVAQLGSWRGERKGARPRNHTWRMHIDIQSPCQCLEANTPMGWLTTKSITLKTETAQPQQKLLLGVRCCCNTKKDAKKGNLKMWFSVEGLQYSKMLLFLSSVPLMCSESGLLTWVTRHYFCFFFQLVLQSKCMIKGQSLIKVPMFSKPSSMI